MSEIKIRKKLSLGVKKISPKGKLSENLRKKIDIQKSITEEKSFLRNKEVAEVFLQRKSMLKQIQQLENRLKFATSTPLQDLLFELKSKDFELLIKMNDILAKS